PCGDRQAMRRPCLGGELNLLAAGPARIDEVARESRRINESQLNILPGDVVKGCIEAQQLLEHVAFHTDLVVVGPVGTVTGRRVEESAGLIRPARAVTR